MKINEKEFLGFRSNVSEDCEFLAEANISLDFEEYQVEPSESLKSVVGKNTSRTQETSRVPEFSTSLSNQDLYSEFRKHSDPHVKTVQHYGCPIDNSQHFLNVYRVRKSLIALRKLKRLNRETIG